MKFSESWLREWVDPDLDTGDLVEQLTMAGLEVDAADPLEIPFAGPVVVARIIAAEPHPELSKLQVCRVDAGDGEVRIVCGAANAREGLVTVLARPGAMLPGGLEIGARDFKGIASAGMLCAATELGLGEGGAGILELPPEVRPGTPLVEHLGLRDTVIDVDLTPNRGDCLGMAGIAREVGVLNRLAVNAPDIPAVPASIDDRFEVSIEAPDACPRYAGRVLLGVRVDANSPGWLTERLRRSGIRSIDPVVDVTNYVLLELGQPMHAFDLDVLRGGIRVRMAKAGEQLELLSGDTVELDTGTLVIADHERAVAMAGIMGGAETAVGPQTRDLFLESAFFSPLAIAGRARSHGLSTDSSHRFERGVDPQLQVRAIERATALLLEITGGQAGPVIDIAHADHLPTRKPVALRGSRLQRILGMSVDTATIEDIFGRMGFGVETDGADQWTITPPGWRFDIEREEDLVEEVARVHGYNRLPSTLPAGERRPRQVTEDRLSQRAVRGHLVARGYREAITYSFVEPGLQQRAEPQVTALPLSNPISSDMAVMRTTLLPGLLKAVQFNQHRQSGRVRLFESGLCFLPGPESLVQVRRMGLVMAGSRHPEHWSGNPEPVDYFDLKGDLESLFAMTGEADAFAFEAATHPALHPGQGARILRNHQPAGWIGAVHPGLLADLDLDGPVFFAEIDDESLVAAHRPEFSELSRFPEVRRDLAFVVDREVPAGDLRAAVANAAGACLQNLVLFDVYQGKGIDPARKSIALGLTLQHPSHTLNEDEVKGIVDCVVRTLETEYGASLRS